MSNSKGNDMRSLDGDSLAVDPGTSVESNNVASQAGKSNHEKSAPGQTEQTNGPASGEDKFIETDAVVVGAGFSGISAIYRLRQKGLKVKAFEAAPDFGGVWQWNRYPGARVDSPTPFYQLNIPEVSRTWKFSLAYPDHVELRRYFTHIEKTLNLRKDVEFNSRVIDSSYDAEKGRWTVKTNTGHTATCKYLILATGALARRYTPDFPGLEDYKGEVHHSGFWPDGLDVVGKKVALIGAGATAVQITQELGKRAEQLTIFFRRPSYCLPLRQISWGEQGNPHQKSNLTGKLQESRKTFAGFPLEGPSCGVFDVSKEEREQHFEKMWEKGGFNYSLGNYNDVLLNKEANREVYNFWAKKTRERLSDPVKKDLLAPLEPPYFFGTKRQPLEIDYYDVLDKPNVEIVDLTKNPLDKFQKTGMLMSDGDLREFDVVILATGFDSFTGSLTNMGLKNKDGTDIKEVWKDGIWTYLGIMVNGFPNMFMSFSPQSPVAFVNAPTIIECQTDFIIDTIAKLEKENAKSIEPTHKAEMEWKEKINTTTDKTLLPFTNSWWTGGNVPGKKAESMNYVLGITQYEKDLRSTLEDSKGFDVIKA